MDVCIILWFLPGALCLRKELNSVFTFAVVPSQRKATVRSSILDSTYFHRLILTKVKLQWENASGAQILRGYSVCTLSAMHISWTTVSNDPIQRVFSQHRELLLKVNSKSEERLSLGDWRIEEYIKTQFFPLVYKLVESPTRMWI